MYKKVCCMCEVAFFANQTYCCLSPFSDVAFAAQHYMILYFFEQTINIMESFPFSPGEIDILIVCIILFFLYYCLQMGSSEYVNPSMRTATGTTSGIPNGTEDNPTYVIMQNQKGMRQYYEKYCQIQHVLCIFMQLSPNLALLQPSLTLCYFYSVMFLDKQLEAGQLHTRWQIHSRTVN